MGTGPLSETSVQPADTITLRMDYRAPYAWAEQLAFLRARAVPGVELVTDEAYHRVVYFPTGAAGTRRRGTASEVVGTIGVRHASGRNALLLDVSTELVPHLLVVVAAVRRQFDLDARPDAIVNVLGEDRVIGHLVRARPGLRLPGAFDRFEAAVRALLGQQVSVAAATTLAGRFAAAFGTPLARRIAIGDKALAMRFPTAAEVATRTVDEIARIGLPGARAASLLALANAVATGAVKLDATGDLATFCAALDELPGIGPWTANYLAMRARHDPDAFPAADLGVLKALKATARDSEAKSAAWRPYRAYAVIHLWTSLGDSDGDDNGDKQAQERGPRRNNRRGDARGVEPARPRAAVGARQRNGRGTDRRLSAQR